jgi:hypothetical protein
LNDRRRRLLTLAAVFVLLFVVCLATVLPNGRATQLDLAHVPANARMRTLLPQMGIEDAGFYLRAGHNIAEERGLPLGPEPYAVSDKFILSFWPPGMPFYYAVLFTIFGPEMPVGVVAGAAMALLWALLLTAFFDLVARAWSWVAAGTMVALVLLSDIMRQWILGPGVFWSEGLYAWCVLAALYSATRAACARSTRTRLGWSAAVGAFLGVSAYIRNVSDLFGWLMLTVLAGWGALTGVRVLWQRRNARREPRPAPGTTARRPNWHRQLLGLVMCVVAFQVVTVPWRIYAGQVLRPGNYGWSTESNNLWHDSWTPDRLFVARNQVWLLDGGPNTACHVDESACREIARYERRQAHPYSGKGRYTEDDYRRLAIEALVHHPAEYTIERADYLRKSWFWDATTVRRTEIVQNAVLLVALLAALVLSVRRMRRSGPDLAALLLPGLAVTSLAPLMFIHFESRYFHALKLTGLVGLFVLWALDPIRLEARATAGESEQPTDEVDGPPVGQQNVGPVSAPP